MIHTFFTFIFYFFTIFIWIILHWKITVPVIKIYQLFNCKTPQSNTQDPVRHSIRTTNRCHDRVGVRHVPVGRSEATTCRPRLCTVCWPAMTQLTHAAYIGSYTEQHNGKSAFKYPKSALQCFGRCYNTPADVALLKGTHLKRPQVATSLVFICQISLISRSQIRGSYDVTDI